MNEPFVVTPRTERISLRIDDGSEKVLSIEETFALRSALTRAVSVAHHPKGPLDGVYFDKVDDVRDLMRSRLDEILHSDRTRK